MCDWSQRNEGWESQKSSDDRTYIWWWDECEVSMKNRKRSVSTVAQMIGHNCSYVRWSFLYWPLSFLFATLSNRRSLVCIFNYHCVSESALSCLHIFSVWLMWYGIAGLDALEILSVGKKKILYLLADALTWLVWRITWKLAIFRDIWRGLIWGTRLTQGLA